MDQHPRSSSEGPAPTGAQEMRDLLERVRYYLKQEHINGAVLKADLRWFVEQADRALAAPAAAPEPSPSVEEKGDQVAPVRRGASSENQPPELERTAQMVTATATTTARTIEGWAIVDVLGHQRHVGYVTTEYYGGTAFFRVQTPARPARERVMEHDYWFDKIGSVPKGGKVQEGAVEKSERLIGAGSVYAIQPSSEHDVMCLLESIDPRPVLSATDSDGKVIEKPKPDDDMPW